MFRRVVGAERAVLRVQRRLWLVQTLAVVAAFAAPLLVLMLWLRRHRSPVSVEPLPGAVRHDPADGEGDVGAAAKSPTAL